MVVSRLCGLIPERFGSTTGGALLHTAGRLRVDQHGPGARPPERLLHPDSESKVPNPRKSDLERLRSDLAKELESIEKALESPAEEIGGEKVWVGKNARAWHRELDGRHKKLREQADKLLPLIDAAIRSEPEKVPAGEARSYRTAV